MVGCRLRANLKHIFGGDLKSGRGTNAQVRVGDPIAVHVHAKEALVLEKETPGKQFPHGMELILDLESEPAALLDELLPIIGPDEVQDRSGKRVQGDG